MPLQSIIMKTEVLANQRTGDNDFMLHVNN
jgi:hypothetical protein